MLPMVRPNTTKSTHCAAVYRSWITQPMVPPTTTNRTRARSAHRTTSTALSRLNAFSHVCDGTATELALNDYGQIFFGFLPMLKVLGSADVNSITAGLNEAH